MKDYICIEFYFRLVQILIKIPRFIFLFTLMLFIASSNRYVIEHCLQSYKPVYFFLFEEEKGSSEKSESDKKDKHTDYFPQIFAFIANNTIKQKLEFLHRESEKVFVIPPVSPPPECIAA